MKDIETWMPSNGGSMIKVGGESGAFVKIEDYQAVQEAVARHTMNAIMRICPTCGDDMCGDNHDECFKCKFFKLIFAVETKHPDETREQTALRYIQEAERGDPKETLDNESNSQEKQNGRDIGD